MPLEGEVGCGASDTPHLDGGIKGGRGKPLRVLGVKLDHHDKVNVPFEGSLQAPVLTPVP